MLLGFLHKLETDINTAEKPSENIAQEATQSVMLKTTNAAYHEVHLVLMKHSFYSNA